MIKVSIIVPVYNVSQYVERCLKSVCNQTYKNIECILVDDCGNDDSNEKCKRFIDNYSGGITFEILHHDKNKGLSAARNTGLKATTGTYVYFLDSDDELPQNAIELLVNKVQEYSDIEMVIGTMSSIPQNMYYDTNCFRNHEYVTDNIWIRSNFYTIGKTIPVNGCNKLIRADFIRDNNLYFKEGIIHEDEHWMFYVVKHLKKMAFVFESTYIRYYNEGSIMTTMTLKKDALFWGLIINDWSDNVDSIETKSQIKKILHVFKKYIVNSYDKSINDFHYYKIINLLKDSKCYQSLFCLELWRFILPIRNIRRLVSISINLIK